MALDKQDLRNVKNLRMSFDIGPVSTVALRKQDKMGRLAEDLFYGLWVAYELIQEGGPVALVHLGVRGRWLAASHGK